MLKTDNGWNWASINGLYLTKSWRQLRDSVLSLKPLCAMCKSLGYYTTAVMVDHIKPITEDNWKKLFLDRNNLQPLCDSCHRFKTNRDKVKLKKNAKSIDDILNM